MNEVSALVNCSSDVLASASADGTVRVWDARTGVTTAEMRGHAGRVNALAVDRRAFALYSGGRDKAVHEWQGSTWQAGTGDGLVFAGNVLPPPCGDVVLALAAHSGSSSSSGTVVAGCKNGSVQAWRGGAAATSTSVGHGQINALQVRQPAAAACTGTHLRCSCLAATTCWWAVPTDASSR